MNGMCPDCGYLVEQGFAGCEICEWSGSAPDRVLLPDEHQTHCVRIRELREKGRLFFIRALLEQKEILPKVLRLCNAESYKIRNVSRGFKVFMVLSEKPSEGTLAEISGSSGVFDVELV